MIPINILILDSDEEYAVSLAEQIALRNKRFHTKTMDCKTMDDMTEKEWQAYDLFLIDEHWKEYIFQNKDMEVSQKIVWICDRVPLQGKDEKEE